MPGEFSRLSLLLLSFSHLIDRVHHSFIVLDSTAAIYGDQKYPFVVDDTVSHKRLLRSFEADRTETA